MRHGTMRHFVHCACALAVLTREVAARVWNAWGEAPPPTTKHAEHRDSKQPNPPTWPENVFIFGPKDPPLHIESAVRQAFSTNGGHVPKDHGQFSEKRFAFLFRPGTYHVDVPVGYYTQVLGLGESPDDVVFESRLGIYCEEGNQEDIFGSLSTFWRGAENFRNKGDMLWATSQAAPLRRAIIDGDLALAQYVRGIGMGYASGGFLGNVATHGKLQAYSQQQYLTRNTVMEGGLQGGVWNMVFVGSPGAPEDQCGRGTGVKRETTIQWGKRGLKVDNRGYIEGIRAASINVNITPVIAEKPFISIDSHEKFHINVPAVKHNRIGLDFSKGTQIPFEQVYVATPSDTAADINARLEEGLHLLLTPGIYNLEAPLRVDKDGQVVLGIGLPTLVPTSGTPAIRVGNVDAVRISGVLLQAGSNASETLLQWGDGTYEGSASNPSFMHDVFARVGGANDQAKFQAQAKTMVRIESGYVVGDNLWLWRADHGIGGLVKGGDNPCDTGLVVTGNNVTMYGLAVEHTLKDLVQWSGEGGETYYYQSELPYDVTQDYGDAGYVGYRVNESVQWHRAYGVGVYHYFRDYEVKLERAIAAPAWLENSFEAPLSVYLTGYGTMAHILNGRGGSTGIGDGDAMAQWSCDKGPHVSYRAPTTTSTTTTSTTTTTTSTSTATVTKTLTWTGTSTTVTVTRTTSTATTTATTTTTTVAWWLDWLKYAPPQVQSNRFTDTVKRNAGYVPWLAFAALVQVTSLCCLAIFVCANRHAQKPQNGAMPSSDRTQLLQTIRQTLAQRSRKSLGLSDPSRDPGAATLVAGSPSRLLTPSRVVEGLSPARAGDYSPGGFNEHLSMSMLSSCQSPMTPGRAGCARTLSMSGLSMSGMSLSPGPVDPSALLSPYQVERVGSVAEDVV